ncbi:hypothetical protein JOC86_004125 [Bacillus pakistanensis]|uniref:Uncharacterized protein n=1 Tax=Rossellomorea pakistanensis TaxID=992288 RepID=A0ABS2NI58_9BACI|nr:hypothetical protein [Bacillus pakistanensis]
MDTIIWVFLPLAQSLLPKNHSANMLDMISYMLVMNVTNF